MKRAFLVAAIGFVMLTMVHPGEAQVPGRGFTALLCQAGIDGPGTGRNIDRPPIQTSVTFKRAAKAAAKGPERKRLDFDSAGPKFET